LAFSSDEFLLANGGVPLARSQENQDNDDNDLTTTPADAASSSTTTTTTESSTTAATTTTRHRERRPRIVSPPTMLLPTKTTTTNTTNTNNNSRSNTRSSSVAVEVGANARVAGQRAVSAAPAVVNNNKFSTEVHIVTSSSVVATTTTSTSQNNNNNVYNNDDNNNDDDDDGLSTNEDVDDAPTGRAIAQSSGSDADETAAEQLGNQVLLVGCWRLPFHYISSLSCISLVFRQQQLQQLLSQVWQLKNRIASLNNNNNKSLINKQHHRQTLFRTMSYRCHLSISILVATCLVLLSTPIKQYHTILYIF
jgi:hypothetical protein